MNKSQTLGEYLAPSIKVVETKSQGVLCTSGDTENYGDGAWKW